MCQITHAKTLPINRREISSEVAGVPIGVLPSFLQLFPNASIAPLATCPAFAAIPFGAVEAAHKFDSFLLSH